MAKFDNGDFVKVSGSERVYIVDKLLHTQKQTIPVTADLEIYRVLDDDGEEEVVTSPDMKLVKKSIDEPSAAQQSPLSHEIELNVFYLQAMLLTAAKEDIRYYLAGILFKALNGKVWAFSTDGHRLSRWLIKDDYQGPNFEYIVGRDGIQSILEHKADYKDNPIVLDTRCGFLSVAGIAINNLIDGRYPNALDVANKALQLSDDKEAMPLIDAKYMKGLANAAILLGKYRGNSVCASFEHVIRRDNESNTFVVTGIDNYIQVIMPMRDSEENRSKCIDKAMVIADITNPIHKAINEGKFVKCGMNLIEKMEQRLQKIQRSLRNGVDSEQVIALSSHESGFLTAFSIVKNHNPWQSPDTKPPSEQFVQAMRNGVWGVARYDERFDYWIFRSPQHHFYNPVFSIDKWKFIDEVPHGKPSD